MSSVDNRVVSMEFDNSKFERNATITQKTLSKLKEMLNFKDAGKGFDSINQASGKVNFSAMEKALQTVSSRFSNLGIIGMTVLQNLTNRAVDAGMKIAQSLTSAITQGGKTRALNLEAARFQLEGLKADVDAIMEDVNYAVKGTAYGLDAAAKVASQLVASQVQSGDAMKTALRSISGVAAMTNSTYEDIGNIYTTVAGNGRLMSEQLLQFSSRGLNAAATLGQHLNKSEAEIREMVSKGQIDFATFAAAMDSAFGEHAKEANKTFTGAFSNMKAALSRFGAAFYTPGLEYARNVINALTPVIDNAKAALEPLINLVVKGMKVISEFAVNTLENLKLDQRWSLPIKNAATVISMKLVPALANIKETISGVFSSVSKAFTAVFSSTKTLGQNMFSIGNAFLRFTENIKPSQDTLDKLQRVFQGVFSAISLGIKVVTGIVSIFGRLLSALKPVGKVLLDIAANVGDFVTNLNKAASGSERFSSAMDSIQSILTKVSNKIAEVYQKLSSSLPNIFEGLISVLSFIGGKLRDAFSDMINSAEGFSSGLASKFSFTDVVNAITTGLFGGVLYKLYQFFGSLKNAFEKGESDKLINKVRGLLDQLGETLGQFQQSVKANILVKIAVALGILAASCYTLAKIDPERLVSALSALTTMFIELFAAMDYLMKMMDAAKLKSTFASMELVTSAMIKMAAAVFILAFAVEKLSKLSWEELVKGLGSVGVLCFTLAKTIQKANFSNIKASSFAGLIGLALAMRILASAVAKLGSLDIKQLAKGLGSLIAVLTAVIVAMNYFPNSAKVLAAATAMIELAVAINLLSLAVAVFGSMSLEQLAKGLGSLAVILGIFTGAMIALSNLTKGPLGAKLLVVSTAIAVLAASITLLTPALMTLGAMPLENMIKSLGMLAAVFTVLGAAAYILTPLIPAMLGLGAAVALFGVGIAALGVGVTALSAGLAALSGSAFILIETLNAVVLSLITLIPKAATALAEGFIQFLTTILNGTPQIVGGIITLVQSIIIALSELIPQIIELVTNTLSQLMASMIELMPQFMELVITTIQSIIETITTLIPNLVQLGMDLILGLLEGISTNIYQIVVKASEIVISFMQGISEKLPEIIQAGFDLMLSFINGLADGVRNNMGLVLDAVWNLITAIIESVLSSLLGAVGNMLNAGRQFIKGAIDGIRKGIQWAKEAITTIISNVISAIVNAVGKMLSAGKQFIQGAIDGIRNGIEGARNAVRSVVQGAVNAVKNFVRNMFNAGADLIRGLIDGVKSMVSSAVNAVKGVGEAVVGGIKNLLGIASPSKVFKQLGVYTMEGYIAGVSKMTSPVVEAVKGVGNSAVKSIKKTFSEIGENLPDIDSDITITPVLDLSNVNRGIDSIYSAFDRTPSISLETTTSKALSSLNVGMVSAKETDVSPGQVIYNNYDMTQNNYSPKALSRIEIYRDTKNQFSRLKEVVKS